MAHQVPLGCDHIVQSVGLHLYASCHPTNCQMGALHDAKSQMGGPVLRMVALEEVGHLCANSHQVLLDGHQMEDHPSANHLAFFSLDSHILLLVYGDDHLHSNQLVMSSETGHNQNGLAYALSRTTKYGVAHQLHVNTDLRQQQ